MEELIKNDYLKLPQQNKNIQLNIINPKIKTNIKPDITFKSDNINIIDNEKETVFFNADNINVNIALFPLLRKKLHFNHIYADNTELNIQRDKNGTFNFKKLFQPQSNNSLKLDYKNTSLKIENYTIKSNDEQLNYETEITGSPLNIKTGRKQTVSILTNGELKTNDNISSFDMDFSTNFPAEELNNNIFSGKFIIYNINLKPLMPFIREYAIKDITNLDGYIEFIQLSSEKENNKNNLILNTKFDNLVFDKKDWKNNITADGENKFDVNVEPKNNIIDVKSLNYKAENIDIKADGLITLGKTPAVDINAEIKNSRAENIVSILPPNLTPAYNTIEKIKNYGVFGDIESNIKIKGNIPKPDITGYVKARNVKILDSSLHKLHKGSIDIIFDKRLLNMDIEINLPDNQKADISGYVYMYRDGINNVTIKTTDNIDFPLAQKLVVPISKVFNFQLGPIPDMDIISGKGIIDVNVQGSVDMVNINGYSSFDNADLTYKDLYGEIVKGKGRLDFKDEVVSFKSERAFVKDNPLEINGKVRINKDLDFDIITNNVEAADLMEIINKSPLLKDVKDGIAVITDAKGAAKLLLNIKANIVPVPFGQPPLPPDEAFEDMKVKGTLYLLGNSCSIDGFYTPVENLKGMVDFTETDVDINNITGVSGTSSIIIGGKIINDLQNKIPDVDITVTGKSVNLKDTIKFLTQSYMYPKNYPDLSFLYEIASKHDLYFKYKAKSVDFLTDKAYAVLNFIEDDSDSPLKAKNGKITVDNAVVKVENINADLFNSNLQINGDVKNIDTVNPVYNLKINTNSFNLENLNNTEKINFIPEELKNLLDKLSDFKGSAKLNLAIANNILNGKIQLLKPQFKYSSVPFIFDDFDINIKNNKAEINNAAAEIADMPFFGNIKINNIYASPNIDGYFTSEITDNFIKNYLPENISKRITLAGDIYLSSEIKGNKEKISLQPKLTLNPEADVIIDNVSLGETNDKREYNGNININGNKIEIKNLDYVKYVSSQNNIVYPILFASINGILNINKDNLIEPLEINIKTYKTLSAKVLNVLLKSPILNKGTFNCNLKYIFNPKNKTAKIKGFMDCKNIDIPLFDTLVKNIKIEADDKNINFHLSGFMNDSKVDIYSELKNSLYSTPEFHSLKIYADEVDTYKFLNNLSNAREAFKSGSETNKIDLSGIYINNGYLDIKKYTFKSITADNFVTDFAIDKNGIFSADNINLNVGQGTISGKVSYDLINSNAECNFELNNVDSNYAAESLFGVKNQIFGNASGKVILKTKGLTENDIIKNLNGFVYFDISDGRMPKLGSLEYLLRASNIIKSGITGFSINSILELLNLVKTGYFSNINGSCNINDGIAQNIEIFSKGENLSLYLHGEYDIVNANANMEILGKLSRKISTIFGALGNTSLNTFFKLIPGISILDFGRDNFVEDVEKIPSFTDGDYESRVFQAIVKGNINESNYVQSFKWVK